MNGAAMSALSKAGWSTVRPTQRPWSAICVHTSLLEGEELELQLLDRILRRASRSSPLPEDSIDRLRGEGRLIERGARGTPAAEGRAAVPGAPFARFQSAPAALSARFRTAREQLDKARADDVYAEIPAARESGMTLDAIAKEMGAVSA